MVAQLQRYLVFACVLMVLAVASGCASTEPENESARPWNQPKGWENGMPPGMTQGR